MARQEPPASSHIEPSVDDPKARALRSLCHVYIHTKTGIVISSTMTVRVDDEVKDRLDQLAEAAQRR